MSNSAMLEGAALPAGPRIFILLPVHNRRQITLEFVQCLKRQTYRDFRLILVDDGCTDGTAEMVRREIPDASVIRGDGNLWWAGSLHEGYHWIMNHLDFGQADGEKVRLSDIVLIINDDTHFDTEFLANAVSELKQRPGALLGAQSYSQQTGALIDAGIHVDWRRLTFTGAASQSEINCLSTRGLFMRVRDMRRIGDFHHVLMPHYAADYAFTIRAHQMGFELFTSPRVIVRMNETTTGIHQSDYKSFVQAMRDYFSLRSPRNPVVWLGFLLLTCPWPWLPLNVARVLKNLAAEAVRAALARQPS